MTKRDTRFKAAMGFRLNRSDADEPDMVDVEPGEVVELTAADAREFAAGGRGSIVDRKTPLGKAREAA